MSWEAVDDADGYEVGKVNSGGSFDVGGNWHEVDERDQRGKTTTNSIVIQLDKILFDNTSYDFQVRAIHGTSSNSDLGTTPGGTSPASVAVTITDNPLLLAAGLPMAKAPPGPEKLP